MGQCNFSEDKSGIVSIVKGTTLFAEKENACIMDTGVYWSPAHSMARRSLNIVLWIHGYYVHNAKDLMDPDDAGMDMKLREGMLAAGKDTVLVAPWLGHKEIGSGSIGLGSLGNGDGVQAYLDKVLEGLARYSGVSSLDINNLVIAGHSAGGAMMREAAKHLGKYQEKLRECWGFDCFYDGEYPSWIRTIPKVEKYIYVASGSGGGGLYTFQMMKAVYGTPKKPLLNGQRIPNVYLAPAVDKNFTANDDVAFQSFEDLNDWGAAGPNLYSDTRKATDVFLDDGNQARYWSKLRPKLTGHFQVVRDIFGPRIKQSKWL